jgi:DNA topoisomerase IA
MVEERNWLDVYPYQSWGGNANLPPLAEGQTFTPTELLLKEVRACIGGGAAACL